MHGTIPRGRLTQCNLEAQLKGLPLQLRIKKSGREYQLRAEQITHRFEKVSTLCTQARRFAKGIRIASGVKI